MEWTAVGGAVLLAAGGIAFTVDGDPLVHASEPGERCRFRQSVVHLCL
jgi:hypothetical protein